MIRSRYGILSVGESESPLTCELNYFIDSKSVETVSGGF